MPIQITFTGETSEHIIAGINAFLAGQRTPVSIQEAEAPAEEKPKTTRRGRGPAKKEAEEKPKSTRRGRGPAKAKDKINPLLTDALLVAHQLAEDINEGDELVKEILKEEYQVNNLSDLSDVQLAECTKILTAELNAPDPAED